MKTGTNNLTEEELHELDDALDIFSFEKYCANCDHFPGDDLYKKREYYKICPFKDKFERGIYTGVTEWKKIGCTEFWD